jgi:uncharacterized protein
MAEVSRVVYRRAKPGCDKAYEDLVRAMLDASSRFPGYLSAAVIPPKAEGGEFQIIQRFATQGDLDRWRDSEESAMWHERLRPTVESDPEYRLLTGLEVWFAPKLVPANAPPPRWRMTVVSWLGIYPIVAFCLWYVSPLLQGMPYLLRTAILTAIVVLAMSYLVMPRLSRWMAWWLRR